MFNIRKKYNRVGVMRVWQKELNGTPKNGGKAYVGNRHCPNVCDLDLTREEMNRLPEWQRSPFGASSVVLGNLPSKVPGRQSRGQVFTSVDHRI